MPAKKTVAINSTINEGIKNIKIAAQKDKQGTHLKGFTSMYNVLCMLFTLKKSAKDTLAIIINIIPLVFF